MRRIGERPGIHVRGWQGDLRRSCAGVGIDAKLQALAMNEIGQRLDAGRKVFRIGNDVAFVVARELPAVVDDDVLVAGIFHAGLHHGVGGLAKKIFVDVTLEFVPAVPAHGWSGGKTFLRGYSSRDEQTRDGYQEQMRSGFQRFLRELFRKAISNRGANLSRPLRRSPGYEFWNNEDILRRHRTLARDLLHEKFGCLRADLAGALVNGGERDGQKVGIVNVARTDNSEGRGER